MSEEISLKAELNGKEKDLRRENKTELEDWPRRFVFQTSGGPQSAPPLNNTAVFIRYPSNILFFCLSEPPVGMFLKPEHQEAGQGRGWRAGAWGDHRGPGKLPSCCQHIPVFLQDPQAAHCSCLVCPASARPGPPAPTGLLCGGLSALSHPHPLADGSLAHFQLSPSRTSQEPVWLWIPRCLNYRRRLFNMVYLHKVTLFKRLCHSQQL